jgi:TonB family protein
MRIFFGVRVIVLAIFINNLRYRDIPLFNRISPCSMKKTKSIIVSVPKPCAENWDKMTPAERGRHCASCNKTVIDFSAYTDRELFDFISKNTGSVCGRLSPYQVNRPIVSYGENNSPLWQRIMMGTALVTSLAACNENSNRPLVTGKLCVNDSVKNKPASDLTPTGNYISGRMIDEKSGWHISHLAIRIKGTKYYAVTDTTGNFKISVPDSIIGKRIKLAIDEDSLYEIMPYSYREIEYTIDKLPFAVNNIKMKCTLDEPPVMGHMGSYPEPPPLTGVVVATSPEYKKSDSTVFGEPQTMPVFNGAFYDYLAMHIKYPKNLQDRNIEGTVYVNFIVEANGEISNVRVLKGVTGAPEFDSVAIKAIKEMPKWKPGEMMGKPIRTSMNVPIKFRLEDSQSDSTKNSSHK